MSLNIYIIARREVTFTRKDGTVGTDTQCQSFYAWQTPTQDTIDIISSPDPKQAYVNWVLAHSHYPNDLSENETFNPGIEHVKMLEDFIKYHEEEGYTVSFEMI